MCQKYVKNSQNGQNVKCIFWYLESIIGKIDWLIDWCNTIDWHIWAWLIYQVETSLHDGPSWPIDQVEKNELWRKGGGEKGGSLQKLIWAQFVNNLFLAEPLSTTWKLSTEDFTTSDLFIRHNQKNWQKNQDNRHNIDRQLYQNKLIIKEANKNARNLGEKYREGKLVQISGWRSQPQAHGASSPQNLQNFLHLSVGNR